MANWFELHEQKHDCAISSTLVSEVNLIFFSIVNLIFNYVWLLRSVGMGNPKLETGKPVALNWQSPFPALFPSMKQALFFALSIYQIWLCVTQTLMIDLKYNMSSSWNVLFPTTMDVRLRAPESGVTWICAGLSQLHLLFLTPSHVSTSSSSILHHIEFPWPYVHKWLACSCTY